MAAAADTETQEDTGPSTQNPDFADSDDFEFGKFDDDDVKTPATPPGGDDENDEPAKESNNNKAKSEESAKVSEDEDDAKETKEDDLAQKNDKKPAREEEVQPPPEEDDDEMTSPKSVPKDRANQVEEEVISAFFEWTSQWNSGNLFGFLDAYWEADELRYVSEMLPTFPSTKGQIVIGGRGEVDKIFTDTFVKNKKRQERYKDNMKKGVAGIMSLRKIIVTPTGIKDAIVFGERQMEVAGDKRGSYIGIVFTVHVRKMAGKWKIVSEHATQHTKK